MSVAPVAIELCNASFGWHGHAALRGVSGRFEAGAMTAVVGPNGAGKSTLIKGIMGVLRPLSGRVSVGGVGRSELAWLPQAAELDRSFPVTVLDLVAMGAWRRVGGWRRYGGEEIDRCMQALQTVGLADMAGRGSIRCPADSCSARCSRACWCRMRRCCCSTNPLPLSTAIPPMS